MSPTPTPTPLGRSKPVRMDIPAIGVDGKVARLGLAKNGKMLQLPKKPKRAGWFDRSVTPGEMGPMIVIGYIDGGFRGPGVFKRLRKLGKGDAITMTRADGVVATYRVDRIKSYQPAKLPVRKVYGSSSSPVLRIITCGGSLTKGARPTNVVVYASLVGIRR
jgi:sortase (surface protein transpeptidase)